MMKKFLFSLMALALSVSFACSAKGLQLEGVIGMNVANFDASGASSRIGFHIGVRGTTMFGTQNNGLYGNVAALLSLKGATAADITFNPYYLEIPVHMGYKYGITDDVAIFGEFGPYLGIGLFGTTEGEDVFGDEVGCRRFDMGLGLRAGFEFKQKCSVSLGYDFGLTDISSEGSLKNRNFTVSVGYKF